MKDSFNRNGAPRDSDGMENFLAALMNQRRDLAGIIPVIPEQGKASHTVMIGDEVFKGARFDNVPASGFEAENRAEMARWIGHECRVLKHLDGSGLPVPKVTCTGIAAGGGEIQFFGMTRLPGVKLTRDIVDNMTGSEKRALAKDIAGFMAQLPQALTVEDAKALNFPGDPMTAWEVKPEQVKKAMEDPKVIKALGGQLDFCRTMEAEFTRKYEEEYRNRPMVVTHGDLHGGNILYDPATKRLTGVIDFGGCGFARPEMCFWSLSRSFSDDFTSMICEEYSAKTETPVTLRDVRNWDIACWVADLPNLTGPSREKDLQEVVARIATEQARYGAFPVGASPAPKAPKI